MMLKIINLKVSIGKKEILKGINLEIKPGQLQVIMGPNGSGKSTLAYAIMGHPRYKVANGKVLMANKDITSLSPDKRAKLGLFMAFQHPTEVSGVKMFQFLRSARQTTNDKRLTTNGEAKQTSVSGFLQAAKSELKKVGMSENFLERSLNEGFSGGEKKRSEIFQMAMLKPKIAILDEPDSGLDIDGLKMVAKKIMAAKLSGIGVLLISHNPKILDYLQPDEMHLIVDGKIVKSGDKKIIKEVEKKGFESIRGDLIYSA